MPDLSVIDGAAAPEIRFNLLSRDGEFITAEVSPTGKKIFRGVASSTTRDLHGDVILKSALDDMEQSAVGMTIFLNHSYEVPEDVGGTCTKAVVRQKGVDQDGEPNWQLEVESEVEEENERALKSWRMIRNGRKLGISIGAMIPKGGATRQKDGSYIIEHIKLLEYSIVGIPANPKSWVEYAASALRSYHKAQTTNLGNPTLTLDGDTYKIEGSLQGLELNLGADLSVETPVVLGKDGQPLTEPETDFHFAWDRDNKVEITRSVTTPVGDGAAEMVKAVLGSWDLSDPDQKLAAIALAGEEAVEKATVWVETRDGDKITIGDPEETADADPEVTGSAEPDVANAACPTCGKGRSSEGCDDAYHKDVDPDVTDAKVRIIEVDTDSPESGDGQGASDSEPDESALSTEPEILDGLTETELLKLSFGQLRAAALAAVNQLGEVKRLYDEEKTARLTAESQRDTLQQEREAVIAAAGALVKRTQAVIEKVANSPLARKAVTRDIATEFATSVSAFYGEEFARAIVGDQSH